jgi:hypothetical protein
MKLFINNNEDVKAVVRELFKLDLEKDYTVEIKRRTN